MARRLTTMLKREENKRLKELGMGVREIARNLNCSRKTVRKYLPGKDEESVKPTPIRETPLWVLELDWEQIRQEHTSNKKTPLSVLWEEGPEEGNIPVTYAAFWKQYKRRYPDLLPANGQGIRPR